MYMVDICGFSFSMRDIVCYCVSNCLIILVDFLLKIFNMYETKLSGIFNHFGYYRKPVS